ncbi:MAG: DUF2809 domain-containing protein [Oscillospiraceae bacterium]|nr:DUF2809 domain-containing protein [Oscillospiraceae bacterium]
MPVKRFIFGFWAVGILAVEVAIAFFAKGFIREYVGDVLAVVFLYMLARVFFPQKPQFMSAIAFGVSVIVELLQLTPLHGFLNERSEVLAVIAGGTFDYRDLICYFIGGLICAVVDIFIIGKSKKISG